MGGLVRQYSWVLNLVGMLFVSFLLAKITGVYLGKTLEVERSIGVIKTSDIVPPERRRVDVSEYKVIVDRDIFDATGKGEATQTEASGGATDVVIPTGEAVKTNLDIKVIGVLVVGDGRDRRSTATVMGGGGGSAAGGGVKGNIVAGVYAVGDEEGFAQGTRLTRVQPDRIEFINDGRLEYAELATEFGEDIFGPPKREPVAAKESETKEAKGALIKKEGSGKFTVDQREIDDALQNLDRLYTDIRAVPNFSGGKVSGMKILSVKSDSIFAKLGLRRGDVLQKINGLELDVRRGFEIFSQLKDQKSISLDLIRQGQPTTLEYEIR